MWSNWELYQHAYKTAYIEFRYIIFPINMLSEKNCVMFRGMRKPHEIKVMCYAVCTTEINDIRIFSVSKASKKIGDT